MLLIFLQFLVDHLHIKVPAVFWYSSTRMVLSALTTLLLTISLGPMFINKLYRLKTGQSIRVEDCPMLAELHQKKKETPTMGGGLILISMIISLFLWMDLKSSFTLLLLIGTVWLGVVGGVDDYLKMKYKNSKGLQSKKKFFLQVILASLFSLYLLVPAITQSVETEGWFSPPISKEYQMKEEKHVTNNTQETYGTYYIPFKRSALFSLEGGGLILSFVITVFVVTAFSNAVNLADGLDGLASGCILLVALFLALFAFLSNHIEMARYLNIPYLEGSGEIAIYLCAVSGACLGFLWYNGYPAQVFMGDIGSLALGGVLGMAAVLLRREVLCALVGGVFVLEALSVVLQVLSYRFRNKKRVFLCAPLHHHFEFDNQP